MTIDGINSEFLKPKSTVSYLMGKETAVRWIQTLKRRFWVNHHLWFGSLNDKGEYGLPSSESEYRYSLIRYFSFIKGNIIRAGRLKGEAVDKGLLTSGIKDTPFLLSEPIKDDEKK